MKRTSKKVQSIEKFEECVIVGYDHFVYISFVCGEYLSKYLHTKLHERVKRGASVTLKTRTPTLIAFEVYFKKYFEFFS